MSEKDVLRTATKRLRELAAEIEGLSPASVARIQAVVAEGFTHLANLIDPDKEPVPQQAEPPSIPGAGPGVVTTDPNANAQGEARATQEDKS